MLFLIFGKEGKTRFFTPYGVHFQTTLTKGKWHTMTQALVGRCLNLDERLPSTSI